MFVFIPGDLHATQSDTEAFHRRGPRRGKSITFEADYFSESETKNRRRDKAPRMRPSQSLEEVALQQMTQNLQNQPRAQARRVYKPDSNRPINYTRGIYRPTPLYWRGANRGVSLSTSQYNDSELISQLWEERHRSMTTDSEGEADMDEMSFNMSLEQQQLQRQNLSLSDDRLLAPGAGSQDLEGQSSTPEDSRNKENQARGPQGLPPPSPGSVFYPQPYGSFQPLGSGSLPKKVKIVDGRRKRKHKHHKDLPPKMIKPGPVDYKNYGPTAKLWMEQVDKHQVEKSKTMYLSVMSGDQAPPDDLARLLPADPTAEEIESVQWVLARGRNIRKQVREIAEERQRQSRNSDVFMSGAESDMDPDVPMSPGKQMLLFFRIGTNWRDLAWVLFDGLQSDSETIRMIKDIQTRHPHKVNEQIHSMMHRWWKKKGSGATIEQLQYALDLLSMAHINEEYVQKSATESLQIGDTAEDDRLEISELSDPENDPDVSRLIEEYHVRSANASFDTSGFVQPSGVSQSPVGQQKSTFNPKQLSDKLEDSVGSRIDRSRVSSIHDSLPRDSRGSRQYYDSDGPMSDQEGSADGSHSHSFIIMQPQLQSKDVSTHNHCKYQTCNYNYNI